MEQFASCSIPQPAFKEGERIRLTKLTQKGG
jgi:hypothetical protein